MRSQQNYYTLESVDHSLDQSPKVDKNYVTGTKPSFSLEEWLDRPVTESPIIEINLRSYTSAKLTEQTRGVLSDIGWVDNPEIQLKHAAKFCDFLKKCAPVLSASLEKLRINQTQAVFISGLPSGCELNQLSCLAISSLLGEPFNFKEQNPGHLVMPIQSDPNSSANTNATTGHFGIHTDDAALLREMRAHWLCLVGNHGPAGVYTGYASLSSALEFLISREGLERTKAILELLMEDNYSIRVPKSFVVGEEYWTRNRPIIFDTSNGLELAYPSYAIRPRNELCQKAVDLLTEALASVQRGVQISNGCCLVFSNLHGAHSRTEIPSGESRLIYRTYSTKSLTALRKVTNNDGPIFQAKGNVRELCEHIIP